MLKAQNGCPVKGKDCILPTTQMKGANLFMELLHQSLWYRMPHRIKRNLQELLKAHSSLGYTSEGEIKTKLPNHEYCQWLALEALSSTSKSASTSNLSSSSNSSPPGFLPPQSEGIVNNCLLNQCKTKMRH